MILIVGVSTRALVESAGRAGHRCAGIDAFGDLDQAERVVALPRDHGRAYSAAAAAALARHCSATAVAYVANLENHPGAVRRLAAGRELLGNGPATLERVRDPERLAEVVRAAGEHFPLTLSAERLGAAAPGREWLRKPRRGGGGSGVAPWRPGMGLAAREMLQERIPGTLASAAFAADGRQARLLGVSLQMAGESAFGARGFRYCGSIYPLPAGHQLRRRLEELAQALTAGFALRGMNGVDLVLRGEEIHVLEVNPRPTASVELIERATGLSVFDAHAGSCRGRLPDAPDLPGEAHGKAILFARREVVLGDTRRWLGREQVRDVPHPGSRMAPGHPICTVFARGGDPQECAARLVRTASALEREIYGAG